MTEAEHWGSWRDDYDRKLTVGLEATAAERLAWLEEMLQLAHASGAPPKARDAWGQTLSCEE